MAAAATAASAVSADQPGGRTRAAAAARPASAPSRRSTNARKAKKTTVAASRWKFDSGWPPKNCSGHHGGEAADGQGRRPADDPLGEQEQPRQQRPHVRLRPGDPDQEVEAERVDQPGQQRAAEAHAERATEQVGAEGGGKHLQHRDQPERPPERQHVGGQAERRQHRRLRVREVRAPGRDVGVPQRRVREPLARVSSQGWNWTAESTSS